MTTSPLPHLDIFPFADADIRAVCRISRQSFTDPTTDEEFSAAIERGCLIDVLAIDGQVVGYIQYRVMKRIVSLEEIAIDPDFRRWGVGRAAINRLTALSLKYKRRCVRTMVRETNARGRAFFEACGFRELSAVERPYGTNERGIIYVWRAE